MEEEKLESAAEVAEEPVVEPAEAEVVEEPVKDENY